MAKGRFSTGTRSAILERAGGFCERCALPLRKHGHIHHRKPRGMGGTDDSTLGGASNGMWVHAHCHQAIESKREEAYRNGWLVRRQFHPMTIPIFRWGRWVILDDDGSVKVLELPEDHAIGDDAS